MLLYYHVHDNLFMSSPPRGVHLAHATCPALNWAVLWELHYTVLNGTKMNQSALSPISTLSIYFCQTLAIINSVKLD